jgi:hypothetical protein
MTVIAQIEDELFSPGLLFAFNRGNRIDGRRWFRSRRRRSIVVSS